MCVCVCVCAAASGRYLLAIESGGRVWGSNWQSASLSLFASVSLSSPVAAAAAAAAATSSSNQEPTSSNPIFVAAANKLQILLPVPFKHQVKQANHQGLGFRV